MTTRLSNSKFLTVLDPIPLEQVGWYARVLSQNDWATQIALVERFAGLGFTKEENGVGGGQIVLDAQDRLFSDPLPVGESVRVQDQEALWQIIEDGVVRFEFLAEDLKEDVLTESGELTTEISGRGTGSVLEWAPVLPDGMPTPTSMSRTFTAAPMAAWVQLFDEAQADGYIPEVSLLFDASTDSAGEPWGGAQDVSIQAGDKLLDVLTRFCEQGEYIWKMVPGFRLMVLKNPGQNRELDVVFTMYRDQAMHQRMVDRRGIANVVYAASADSIAIAQDLTSQALWRKRAAWTTAGGGDASARSAVANTTLAITKDDRQSRTIQIDPTRETKKVFTDFDVSDIVGIETTADDPFAGSRKVVAISIDIDSDGVVAPELTLQSRFESRLIRQQRMLEALGGSQTEGSGATPIPVTETMTVQKLRDLADVDTAGISTGDVLIWDGAKYVDATPNLNLLSDVTLGAPTDGMVLTYDSTAGLWQAEVVPPAVGATPLSVKQYYPPPPISTAASSAGQTTTKGGRLLAMAKCRVTQLDMFVTGVAGKTYRLACWRAVAPGWATLEAQIGSNVDVASPGTGKQRISSGTVAWDLDAGRAYVFMVYATDGSAVQVWNGGTAAAGSIGTLLAGPPAVNNLTTCPAAPAAAAVLTGSAGTAEMEITANAT